MQAVSIVVEVFRGDKLIHRIGTIPGVPAEWSSPYPLADIVTPQGSLRGLLIVSCLRGQEVEALPEDYPAPDFMVTP